MIAKAHAAAQKEAAVGGIWPGRAIDVLCRTVKAQPCETKRRCATERKPDHADSTRIDEGAKEGPDSTSFTAPRSTSPADNHPSASALPPERSARWFRALWLSWCARLFIWTPT